MPEERLTEDLLARLRAAASPQEYLDEEVTLDRTLARISMNCWMKKA